ncbi:LOW QUALITY PROTEIN: hypothetical protein Cgig2_012565 [Carnegiea gigantea]|uniref:Uncharacterized protein n=1 Tax=Carnegiea gigantea TaxID=171969 RepID=A0A9Q1K2R1_9CARY|nr:LOW QUALITY PROTEIN: hypothetical protein Cgig2_012565 [Carnegiea gigantea]
MLMSGKIRLLVALWMQGAFLSRNFRLHYFYNHIRAFPNMPNYLTSRVDLMEPGSPDYGTSVALERALQRGTLPVIRVDSRSLDKTLPMVFLLTLTRALDQVVHPRHTLRASRMVIHLRLTEGIEVEDSNKVSEAAPKSASDGAMKICAWNCRGLGSNVDAPTFPFLVHMVCLNYPDIFYLFETEFDVEKAFHRLYNLGYSNTLGVRQLWWFCKR